MEINNNHLNNPGIDSTSVKRLLLSDSVAQFVFQHLATRKNNAAKTLTRTYENLLKDKVVPKAAITRCWKELQAAGCGTYIQGAGGKKSRFVWAVDTREFCEKAILAL